MSAKPINQVVAEALRHYMSAGGWTKQRLSERAGVAANTIKNVLEPEARARGASGKEPSVKLTELSLIAQAIGVPVADLVTDMDPEERHRALQRRAADYYAEHGELPDWAPLSGKRDGTHG